MLTVQVQTAEMNIGLQNNEDSRLKELERIIIVAKLSPKISYLTKDDRCDGGKKWHFRNFWSSQKCNTLIISALGRIVVILYHTILYIASVCANCRKRKIVKNKWTKECCSVRLKPSILTCLFISRREHFVINCRVKIIIYVRQKIFHTFFLWKKKPEDAHTSSARSSSLFIH